MELSKDIKGRILIELYNKTGSVDVESVRIAERGYREKYKEKGVAYATGQQVGRMYEYVG